VTPAVAVEPAGQKEPAVAAQFVHVAAPEPAKVPAAQSVQTFVVAAAADPAGHSVHTALCVASKYCPARHHGVPVMVTPIGPIVQEVPVYDAAENAPTAMHKVPVGFVNAAAVGAAKLYVVAVVPRKAVGIAVDVCVHAVATVPPYVPTPTADGPAEKRAKYAVSLTLLVALAYADTETVIVFAHDIGAQKAT
jgi:hypothetical protein